MRRERQPEKAWDGLWGTKPTSSHLKGKREIKIKVIHIVTSSERLFGSTNSYAGIPPGGHSAFHRSFQTVVSPSRLMITAREVKETQKRRK